ncbi:MAG TPA: hypothetical protein DCX53_07595 [Anaerolineae bacterium]|nr:hypothetical protein [Anaerolineae bacterium]
MFKKVQKIFDKVYSGNIFERIDGLEFLLNNCKGASILDVGCAEGLISYEFAKNGAKLIHGFEIDRRRVEFAKLLFQEVPIEHNFVAANIAVDFNKFQKQHSHFLLDKYDIVLYLGVYHHLIKQNSVEVVQGFISAMLSRTINYFAVRTNKLLEFEYLILSNGFELVFEKPAAATVGQLKIYKRITE